MERVWHRRLRWRLRGAWQWPLFIALTLAEGVLLHELPIGGSGTDLFPALLLAMFFNLVAVAAAGPLLGLGLRRWRPDLPKIVAADRGGTIALLVTAAVLVALGLGHRSAIDHERAEFAAQSLAMRAYVAHQAPEYQRNIARADSVKLADDYYRTCVPGDQPRRALCLFIDTSTSPPGVKLDSSRAPNTTYVPYGQP